MTTTTQQPATISAIKLYGYKIDLSINIKGKPVARLYKYLTVGKNKDTYKLIEGYYFNDEQRREEWVKKQISLINQLRSDKTQRAESKKAVRANMQHGFQVGQIYYDSWGYDQTNIDFYEIVEVKERSVIIRPLAASTVETGFMCGTTIPIPGKYKGEPQTKHIQFHLDSNNQKPQFYIKSRFGWISLYEKGEKGISCSWYA